MKGTYKPPHTSPNKMKTHSTTTILDYVDKQLKKIHDDKIVFNEMLDRNMDENLEEKFRNIKNMNIDKLIDIQNQSIP